jgi:hypothetical protein
MIRNTIECIKCYHVTPPGQNDTFLTPLSAEISHNLNRDGGGFLRVLRFPPPIKLTAPI